MPSTYIEGNKLPIKNPAPIIRLLTNNTMSENIFPDKKKMNNPLHKKSPKKNSRLKELTS